MISTVTKAHYLADLGNEFESLMCLHQKRSDLNRILPGKNGDYESSVLDRPKRIRTKT